jgi:predicted nuclease of predicted toxin-antitoxin system
MSRVKVLIDEDVWAGLAATLRQRGYEAVSIGEVDRKGLSDEEQLAFAITEQRAMMTHNIQDFAPLAELYYQRNLFHAGIIVARQFEKGELPRRTLALLETVTPDQLANTLRFI